MPAGNSAHIGGPEALIVGLLGVFFIGVAFGRFKSQMRRRPWKQRSRLRPERKFTNGDNAGAPLGPPLSTVATKKVDAADQLRIVLGANFTSQPLLNKREARVFKELDGIVKSCNSGWLVMAQVSLGEILRCKDEVAYSCINSKRVDLLLVDQNCQPRHVVEYQGGAHYSGDAAARDAIKKEALRRAGIGYYEVVAGRTTPSELRQLVEKLVDNPEATDQPTLSFPTISGEGSLSADSGDGAQGITHVVLTGC